MKHDANFDRCFNKMAANATPSNQRIQRVHVDCGCCRIEPGDDAAAAGAATEAISIATQSSDVS